MPVAGAKTRTLGLDLVSEMEVLAEASSAAPALTPAQEVPLEQITVLGHLIFKIAVQFLTQ